MDEAEAYMQLIRENIEYDAMMSCKTWKDRDTYEELYQLICDVICVPRKTIRIGGEDYPYNLVKAKFMGQDISVIINQMRYAAIDKEIEKFSSKWFVPFDDVKYEAYNFKDGELANENKLKALADYATYKEHTPDALPKFKFNGALIKEFKEVLMPEISPLLE